jgi:hypothetical protein
LQTLKKGYIRVDRKGKEKIDKLHLKERRLFFKSSSNLIIET